MGTFSLGLQYKQISFGAVAVCVLFSFYPKLNFCRARPQVLSGMWTVPSLCALCHINLAMKAVQREPKSGILSGKYSSFKLDWLVHNKCLTVWTLLCRKDTLKISGGKKKSSQTLLAYLAKFSMCYPHKTVTKPAKSSSSHPSCFAASQMHPKTSKGTRVARVFTGRESLAGKRSCLLREERACTTLVLQGTLGDCGKFSAPCRVGHARQDSCPWRSRAASV